MSDTEDEILWSEPSASVTRTMLRVKQKSYAIAGIGSVEVRHEGRAKMLGLGGLMTFATLITLVFAGAFAIIPGILAFSGFFGAFADMHELIIRTASGELQAVQGRRAQLERVKAAIEKAFTLRG